MALFGEHPELERRVADYAARAEALFAAEPADGASAAKGGVRPPADPSRLRADWRRLASLGVLPPLTAPGPADGPADAGYGEVSGTLAAIEGIGLAGVDGGLVYAMASQAFGMQYPLRPWLTAEQRAALDGLAGGERLLCHALTEPGGGSDPLSMTTRAEPQPDGGYLLDGEKRFITAAPVADTALVFARTGEAGPFALSAFLVDLDAPGVLRGDPLPKTALPGIPMGGLRLTGVRVPAARRIGEEGAGLAVLTATTTWERALLLGYALGSMRRTLDRTVEWAKERRHFGRRMGASHLVAGRIADMALALYRSRRLLYGAAARLDAGVSVRALGDEASLIKISVTEDHQAFARHAAQLGGVRAYIGDSELAVDLIGPMAGSTYAGPNDLLRITVARQLGLPVPS
ncbi:isovaleryl-CoA dehydrogenase [Streptomyces albus subsp. albus]|nr:isovaleryl-CoA dehydrogenase [Streptomyces albus subsp. albus]